MKWLKYEEFVETYQFEEKILHVYQKYTANLKKIPTIGQYP